MVKARAVYRGSGVAEIKTGPCSLTVERRDAGEKRWPCPVELLAASLASCITLTLAAVAEHKEIELGNLEVEVGIEQEGEGGRISATIGVRGNLTEREKKILFNSAKYCEVGKLLEGPVAFEFALESL